MIKEGDIAPDFTLTAHTGDKIKLSSFKGRIVVLYFYPRAMTPGCTRETIGFTEKLEEFERFGAVVLGISTDSVERNRKFAEKHGVKFPLLCDTEGEVVKRYGVARLGSSRLGANRVTFVISPEGKIIKIIKNVKPEQHVLMALDTVKEYVNKK